MNDVFRPGDWATKFTVAEGQWSRYSPPLLALRPSHRSNPPGDNRFESSEGLRVGVEAGYARRSESVSEPLEITAVSRIHGTRRIHEVTGGHEEDPFRVQEEPRGHHRTREDTPLRRFGTVRPRVQIPGPRPISSSKSPILDVIRSLRGTAGAQLAARGGPPLARWRSRSRGW